jgi:hypothetical protein
MTDQENQKRLIRTSAKMGETEVVGEDEGKGRPQGVSADGKSKPTTIGLAMLIATTLLITGR